MKKFREIVMFLWINIIFWVAFVKCAIGQTEEAIESVGILLVIGFIVCFVLYIIEYVLEGK